MQNFEEKKGTGTKIRGKNNLTLWQCEELSCGATRVLLCLSSAKYLSYAARESCKAVISPARHQSLRSNIEMLLLGGNNSSLRCCSSFNGAALMDGMVSLVVLRASLEVIIFSLPSIIARVLSGYTYLLRISKKVKQKIGPWYDVFLFPPTPVSWLSCLCGSV